MNERIVCAWSVNSSYNRPTKWWMTSAWDTKPKKISESRTISPQVTRRVPQSHYATAVSNLLRFLPKFLVGTLSDGCFQPELSLKKLAISCLLGLGPEQCTKEMTALRGIPGSTRGSHWIRCCWIVYKTYSRETSRETLEIRTEILAQKLNNIK